MRGYHISVNSFYKSYILLYFISKQCINIVLYFISSTSLMAMIDTRPRHHRSWNRSAIDPPPPLPKTTRRVSSSPKDEKAGEDTMAARPRWSLRLSHELQGTFHPSAARTPSLTRSGRTLQEFVFINRSNSRSHTCLGWIMRDGTRAQVGLWDMAAADQWGAYIYRRDGCEGGVGKCTRGSVEDDWRKKTFLI